MGSDYQKYKEYYREYARANRKSRNPETDRAADLKKHYGISIAVYEDMLKAQDGVCAICKGSNANKRRLSVDHNHSTGEIRGLLCLHCNTLLAYAKESAVILGTAIEYLTN